MDNNTIRVTKAQKLEALKEAIKDDFSKTFPGDAEKGKLAYVFNAAEAAAFLDAEIALLAKKNKGGDGKKPTKKQEENEVAKATILDYLMGLPEDSKGVTCTEMFKSISSLADTSTQYVASMCKQLKDEGKIYGTPDKGKTRFLPC